ncbi:hypothetical protein [Shewanella algae]|uniref:hypothetical protein n=1 Tax=Shewanella algae TaxID=38313 RepID=UPI001AAD1F1E|nr:hypothetical protein [Shewanella algae]MBO2613129.1 hypothetical protein [Shewanella algae]MBO2689045.1 hypothetical protein [Shewanella algae]
MDTEEMTKKLAESAQAFSEPIDFDALIKDGLLIQKGKSYYVPDLDALPEKIRKRVKTINPTKNGIKVTFYKERKSMQKIASQLSDYLE